MELNKHKITNAVARRAIPVRVDWLIMWVDGLAPFESESNVISFILKELLSRHL